MDKCMDKCMDNGNIVYIYLIKSDDGKTTIDFKRKIYGSLWEALQAPSYERTDTLVKIVPENEAKTVRVLKTWKLKN